MRSPCLLLVLVPVALGAASPDDASRRASAYLQAAASTDAFERAESELILTGSRDGETRAFARRMADEHAAAADHVLIDVARRAGLPQPMPAMGDDQAHLLAALQGLQGADLDRAYARQQVLAHRSVLAVIQAHVTGGDVAIVRRAATADLPRTTADLASAERLGR